ncbi:MAG TPA: copper resistance protein CopC [Candidatus Acidoferrum sp.]|nr:copper resistance protein CopC [Candidatus Acidoferrum sp.]
MIPGRAVLAHVGLAKTVPEHDAILERAPTQMHFTFGSVVTITNLRIEYTDGARKGERILVRLPRNDTGLSTATGTDISIELPPLEPATFSVYYQAASMNGEILVDDFSFTIKSLNTENPH